MPGTEQRSLLLALAASAPLALVVIASRFSGSDAMAHAAAFIAVILGLPWIVPAFVAVAVFSAPVFVALHIVGQPQELGPWLSGLILIAGVLACHVNATLLIARSLRRRTQAAEAGLADFLFRPPARIA